MVSFLQEIVKVKRKFNITIPKKLRNALPLRVGQLVEIKLEDDTIIMKPIAEDPSKKLEEIMGGLKAEDIAMCSEEAIIEEARSRLAEKLERR